MVALVFGGGLGLAILYFWFIGNSAAWLLVWAVCFWLAQMTLQNPLNSGFDIAFRGLWVLLLAGIPTFLWGDVARWSIERREREELASIRTYRFIEGLPVEEVGPSKAHSARNQQATARSGWRLH